jgi:hypothetical protein
MSGSRRPSYALRSLAKRPERVALPPGSPALRVWLPSRRCQRPPTRGSLFQLPTLVGFALQSFHPPRRSGRRFPFLSFHPGSFPPNLPGLAAELGGLIPPRKPCPLLLPWMFTPGRGLMLSWAFRPFRLSLPKNPRRGFSPQPHPSRSFPRPALRPNGSGTPGASGSPGPASPSEEGAGPFGLSHRRPCATL